MVDEHGDLQAGTPIWEEAEQGGYQTGENKGISTCLLLLAASVTLEQLQLCPKVAEPLISLATGLI